MFREYFGNLKSLKPCFLQRGHDIKLFKVCLFFFFFTIEIIARFAGTISFICNKVSEGI